MFNSKDLGKRLKDMRIKRNLTQAEIAESLGISKPAYSQYESGTKTPSMAQFISLAKYLKCSPNYLLQDYIPIDDDSNYLSSIIYSLTLMTNNELGLAAKSLEELIKK